MRDGTRTLEEFDASLRGPDHRLNPGTTADLVAATLLAALLTGVTAAVKVLVVAVSARMLAQLAVADGYEVTALDRFGDVDLRAVAPGATAPSNDALAALAADVDADAVVYGAGFENRPDLVARLADGRELLGTPAELLAAVRDPWAVGAAARAAGARAPETRSVDELPTSRRSPARAALAAQAARRRRRARRAPLDGRPAARRRRSCSAASTGCRARRSRSATAAAPPCSASPSSCTARRASGGRAT